MSKKCPSWNEETGECAMRRSCLNCSQIIKAEIKVTRGSHSVEAALFGPCLSFSDLVDFSILVHEFVINAGYELAPKVSRSHD